MYNVKIVNKIDSNDVVSDRSFDTYELAEKHYNTIKAAAVANKDAIIRLADEDLHQTQLTYADVIIKFLEITEDKTEEISIFIVG
jgi:hypothetical protein